MSLLARAALIAALACPVLPAAAHDQLGGNLNFIGDFRRNHEFNDLVKQSRRFLKIGQFDDAPVANRAALASDGWPAEDFRLFAMTAQAGVASLAGTYKLVFNGQATLTASGAAIQNKVFDPGSNTTRADVVFGAGGDTIFIDFTATGGTVRNVRLLRPGVPEANTPLLRSAWASHVSRLNVIRFLDWTRTNGNRDVAWSDRVTDATARTEQWIARWETVVDAANALNRDPWINVPVQASDEYVTSLATLLRDRLASNLNVYVEYGNELWNFSIRDVDMDNHHGGEPFNGATVNRTLAAAAAPSSPIKFEAADDTTYGYRRVAVRLKEISDIFKTVWGAAAINTRVRPVLAGQMSNSFVVNEGLRAVDEGMGVKPHTVFYAIAGAPYIFPGAVPDGSVDEAPGMTVDQIVSGLAAGVANAPNESGAYQYLSHAGMGAWYGLKVMAYEGGFDTFGGQNVAAKRAANLDPRVRAICRDLVNGWHAFGFSHFLWFNLGADSYDTPFGQWPLVEDIDVPATPKNQCIEDLRAASLPGVTVGIAATAAPIAGGNYRGGANPGGPVTGGDSNFGFPGYVEYLLRADVDGTYTIVFNGSAPAGETFRVKLNNATVAASVALPASAGASSPITVTLRRGLNALRLERVAGGSWSVTSFNITLVAATATPQEPITDLNGDLKSDLLYRNFGTGQVFRFLMNGAAPTSGAMIFHEPDLSWRIVADGDFNGDGISDLVWRNSANGLVYVQPFASSGLPAGGAIVYHEPSSAWRIVHTPDLDGDGRADLLWWNQSTGQVFAVLMLDATTVKAQGMVYTEPDTAWRIVAVGDFAGSGKANQLVWRHATGGHVYLMTVSFAGGAFSQAGAMIYREADTNWRIASTADFNGDGRSDLLWRNAATGQWYGMLMSGGTIVAQGMIHTEPDTAWKVVATGDYDGDGKADLLWRRETSGHVYLMRMNGLAIASQGMLYVEPDTAWRVMGPWEYGLASGMQP